MKCISNLQDLKTQQSVNRSFIVQSIYSLFEFYAQIESNIFGSLLSLNHYHSLVIFTSLHVYFVPSIILIPISHYFVVFLPFFA